MALGACRRDRGMLRRILYELSCRKYVGCEMAVPEVLSLIGYMGPPPYIQIGARELKKFFKRRFVGGV